jgi:very-long-chain ceramide synthase
MSFCFFPGLNNIVRQLAKMLRYLGLTTICDATFVAFLASWLVTRHFFFLFTIKSTYYDAPRIAPLKWDPENGYFMTKDVFLGFSIMLSALQVHYISLPHRHQFDIYSL